jgi:hypothetical protein
LINNILNIIFIPILASIVVASFCFKSKSNEESYSKKIILFIKKEYPIIVTFLLGYIAYNYLYYRSKFTIFSSTEVYNIIWFQWDSVINWNIKLLKLVVKSLFSESILKVIIIGYLVGKFLLNQDIFEKIKYFISQIREINIKDFSIKTQEAIIQQQIKEKEIESIKREEQSGDIMSEEAKMKIKTTEIEKEVIALMVDNSKIVKYIDRFINKESSSITIPLNLIPQKISLTTIEKLFNYEMGFGAIKLIGIKPEKLEIVKEVFSELLEKGIIYSEN